MDPLDVYALEGQLGRFYPNHIISVVDNLIKKPDQVERANALGYSGYFSKPVNSMLGARKPAHRSVPYAAADVTINFPEWDSLSNWLVADYNQAEAAIIFDDFWSYSDEQIKAGMRAAKDQGKRTIYYLNGVLKRDAADRAGRVAEIQRHEEEAAQQGWSPDEFEKLDAGERAEVQIDWVEQQERARFIKAMESL